MPDSATKTIGVTLAVAFVGAVLVSTSAVLLKPRQIANKELDRRQHIKAMAQHLPGGGEGISLEPRIVDLASGEYADGIDPTLFDQRLAARTQEDSVAVSPEADLAGLSRRAKRAVVYLATREGEAEMVILPIRGQGFGSMLYGYLGLAADADTVIGLSFYEHSETPGLGALIDTAEWRRQWRGKKVRDGVVVRLGIGAGRIDPESEDAAYQVDALTGATWTGLGINNLLHYWLGPDGFGPFLDNFRRRRG